MGTIDFTDLDLDAVDLDDLDLDLDPDLDVDLACILGDTPKSARGGVSSPLPPLFADAQAMGQQCFAGTDEQHLHALLQAGCCQDALSPGDQGLSEPSSVLSNSSTTSNSGGRWMDLPNAAIDAVHDFSHNWLQELHHAPSTPAAAMPTNALHLLPLQGEENEAENEGQAQSADVDGLWEGVMREMGMGQVQPSTVLRNESAVQGDEAGVQAAKHKFQQQHQQQHHQQQQQQQHHQQQGASMRIVSNTTEQKRRKKSTQKNKASSSSSNNSSSNKTTKVEAVRCNNKRALDSRWPQDMLVETDYRGKVQPYLNTLSQEDQAEFKRARRRHLNRQCAKRKQKQHPERALTGDKHRALQASLQDKLAHEKQRVAHYNRVVATLEAALKARNISF